MTKTKRHLFASLSVLAVLSLPVAAQTVGPSGEAATPTSAITVDDALGLRPGLTTKLVVLPQALRVIIPPLISQFLSITKNTSLGIAVGYMDLRSTLGGITMNQTGRELESMLLMMAIYLTISLVISFLMNIYNRSIKLKER